MTEPERKILSMQKTLSICFLHGSKINIEKKQRKRGILEKRKWHLKSKLLLKSFPNCEIKAEMTEAVFSEDVGGKEFLKSPRKTKKSVKSFCVQITFRIRSPHLLFYLLNF